MKNLRLLARLLLLGVGLGWLSAGCNNGTDDGTTPQGNCRIQRISSTTKAGIGGDVSTDEIVYDYNQAGNLLKKTQVTESNSLSVTNTTTTTETYTYSADSLLTTSTYSLVQQVNFYGKPSTYQYTWTKLYTYTNNRLTGYTQRSTTSSNSTTSGPQQQTGITTGTYTYDAQGQLIRETNSNGTTWTYQNGQVVAITGSFPYTVQNGLVTKARFPGTNSAGAPFDLLQTFEYDGQRRLIKSQEFKGDSLDNYFTQEWQTGKPASVAVPVFKGHPIIQPTYGELGVLTKYRYYFINLQTHTASPYMERTYTNQLNKQGFITNTKLETVYFTNGQTQPNVTTITYTYTGCN